MYIYMVYIPMSVHIYNVTQLIQMVHIPIDKSINQIKLNRTEKLF